MMKREIHRTKVRIDLDTLANEVSEAKKNYMKVGTRETHEGRSLFSVYNNMSKFTEKLAFGEDTLEVIGSVDDLSTQRVYYAPSVTSLPKPFRKCIVPTNPENIFMFFDLKAAEFFMTAWFAGQMDIVNAYKEGKDPYDELSRFFPAGTQRKEYKTTLIASLYGSTAYSVGKRMGLSEAHAQRLLDASEKALPQIQMQKARIIRDAYSNGYYRYPKNMLKTEFGTIPYKAVNKGEIVGFVPNLALSVFTQSALGFWMQNLIHRVTHKKDGSPRANMGTVLTVFDSMLVEIHPSLKDRWEEFIIENIQPFKTKVSFGTTFYEAAYGNL